MAVDVASGNIVQVSSGIARHWPGLAHAEVLVGAPYSIGSSAAPRSTRTAADRSSRRSWANPANWECLGHRSGNLAVLEWLPQATTVAQLRVQNRTIAEIVPIIVRLRHADRTATFLPECAHIVQDVTDFDRVMIYRFLPDDSGEVVAEHTSGRLQPKFVGLRFPATDIPARALMLGDDIAEVLRQQLPKVLAAVNADMPGVRVDNLVYVAGPKRQPHPANHVVADVLARLDQTQRAPRVRM